MAQTPLPTGFGFIDPNFPNPHGPGDARIIIYGYTPNFIVCILGIVLFALAFVTHAVEVWYYRLWSFTPLTVACLMEVIGYTFRALSSRKDPYRITYFVIQYFLIVTAPVLISASLYIYITKLIAWAETEGVDLTRNRLLRRGFILWTFISVDVVTTTMQMIGAGMIGGATSKQKDPGTANHILLAGLAVQTFAFLIFLVLLARVLFAIGSNRTLTEKVKKGKAVFLTILSTASLLVFVRTVFRLVETSQGVFGYLSSHEGFFAGLEFSPMVAVVLLLMIWHPGRRMSSTARRNRKNAV